MLMCYIYITIGLSSAALWRLGLSCIAACELFFKFFNNQVVHKAYNITAYLYSTMISSEVSKKLHKLPQALLFDLELSLYEHVNELLCVSLSPLYHFVQLWTDAVEEDSLLLTTAPTVLGYCFRLNQLQIKDKSVH